MLSGILLFGCLFPAPSIEIITLEKGPLRGELEAIQDSQFVLRVSGIKQSIAFEDTMILRNDLAPRERKPSQHLLELISGDILRGNYQSGNDAGMSFLTQSLGQLSVSLDSFQRMLQLKTANTEDPHAFARAEGKDRFYKKLGNTTDFVDGSFEGFEKDQIQFRSKLGLNSTALDELVALVLTPLEEFKESKELKAVLELRDGSRISGKLVGYQGGKLELNSSALGKQRIELQEITKLRFQNGRYLFLSDLDPVKVEEFSPFGGSDTVLFPFRKDQNVSGKPLRVGGQEYSRGLGVHSRCVLHFRLGKSYRIFRCSIGIDDEVLGLSAKGSVIFRVWADGKKLYESPTVRGGSEAVSLPDLDVKGADQLSLEVDYADDFHVADRANWLDPILIQ